MRAITFAALAAMLLAAQGCSVPPAKAYAYPAWGFAASFREPPTESASPASPGGPGGFRVASVSAGRTFSIEVADGSASPKSDETILREFPTALAQGGTLASQIYVAAGPVTGRELLIERTGQATQRVRIFVSRRRLYAVSAQSSLGPKDPEVERFLTSFRLLGG